MPNNKKWDSKKSNKGSKSSKTGKSKSELDTTKVEGKVRSGGNNDISWYSRSQQMVIDASNLSYSSILGAKLERDPINWADAQTEIAIPSIPGIMEFRWQPAINLSATADSTINVAANRMYSFVRHANSGHANYESSDLMLYILAMDSLYSLHAMGVRAYGIARYYQMLNRYVPDELLNACGFDHDIIYNLADFRLFLNSTALKLSALAVPAEFDYFKRHVWLSSGVYTDSPYEKSQLYVFTPRALWKFDNTASELGGLLKVENIRTEADHTPVTFARYQELVNSFGAQLYADEDTNIMSGDILKAYGNEGVIRIGLISEDYQVVPEFNYEVLSQIQNMNIRDIAADAVGTVHNGTIFQDDNKLFFSPHLVHHDTLGNNGYKMFTVHGDRPTAEETMIASRLTFMTEDKGDYEEFTSVGSEWVTKAVIYSKAWCFDSLKVNYEFKSITYTLDSLNIVLDFFHVGDNTVDEESVLELNGDIMEMLSVTKFQMHPIFEVYTPKYSSTTPATTEYWFRDYLGDVDTFTQVTRSTLRKMHDAALLSLLHVDGAYRR